MTKMHVWHQSETLIRVLAKIGLVVCFICGIAPFHALASPAPVERQNFLAIDYRFKISQTTVVPEREVLYLRLIDECPETELAEESYWNLSNLYLDDFDEPKVDKAIEILELFLKRYPKSRWATPVESRLQWLRGESSVIP